MVWYRPVAGAFNEVNARLRGESPDVLHGEDQRLVDEPMQNQSMLRRVNIRDAAVMALIEQTVWRDDAVEILQRRAARGRNVLRRVFRHMADDVLFVFGRCPVGLTAGRITGRLRPFGNIGGTFSVPFEVCAIASPARAPAATPPATPCKKRRRDFEERSTASVIPASRIR